MELAEVAQLLADVPAMEIYAFMRPEIQFQAADGWNDLSRIAPPLHQDKSQKQEREIGVSFPGGVVAAFIHEHEERIFVAS